MGRHFFPGKRGKNLAAWPGTRSLFRGMSEVKKFKVKINQVEYEVPAGWSVIQACQSNGIEVPHYCYHPDLSVAGNCRMCLVKVSGAPRPVIACATPVSDNMEIDTVAEDVVTARKSVMEFLLINHPLDCPECDQAGECRLQDYSYQYGRDHGRFEEAKNIRTKSTLGPHVKYWGSRCIVCTRCVRFTDEISGTGELAVTQRGDRSEISVFPGLALDNPLSLNTVDVCPVGALVSADFLYQSRVWNMHSNPSICPDCSLGCNSRVDIDKQNKIKRIIPRRNNDVNKEWMCDNGRLSFPYVYQDRLNLPIAGGQDLPWAKAYERAAEALGDSSVAFLVSLWTPLEAMEKIKQLAAPTSGAGQIYGFGNAVQQDQVFPGFTIHGDKNPNRKGFEQTYGPLKAPASADFAGKTVFVFAGVPNLKLADHPGLSAALSGAKRLVVIDFARGDLAMHPKTELAISGLTHFEKAGSYINAKGMRQGFSAVIEPVAAGRSEAEVVDGIVRAKAALQKA